MNKRFKSYRKRIATPAPKVEVLVSKEHAIVEPKIKSNENQEPEVRAVDKVTSAKAKAKTKTAKVKNV